MYHSTFMLCVRCIPRPQIFTTHTHKRILKSSPLCLFKVWWYILYCISNVSISCSDYNIYMYQHHTCSHLHNLHFTALYILLLCHENRHITHATHGLRNGWAWSFIESFPFNKAVNTNNEHITTITILMPHIFYTIINMCSKLQLAS
jgi:hypothetical protein